MFCTKHIAFSIVALSGIAILTIVRKRSSRLINEIRLRRIKANYDHKIKEGKDLVSQLSDDILVHILVFLPTKDAVRTSILSKRWRNLYAFVPHMEFFCLKTFPSEPPDHFSYRKSGDLLEKIMDRVYVFLRVWFGYKINSTRDLQEKFINGVDRFLRLHSVSSIITCNLSCCFLKSFPNKLEDWIRSLGKLGISCLDLNLMCSDNNHEMINISCVLISRLRSLDYLRLAGCSLQPTSNILPNCLAILKLDKITLAPYALDCILSDCLNLQALFLEKCNTLYPTLRICGSNLPLKYLFIRSCSGIKKIELWADALMLFEYFGCKLIEFSFENVPMLQSIFLTLRRGLNDWNFGPYPCGKLAEVLPPVKSFTLQIQGQYREMLSTPAAFNMFRNVRELLLGFSMFKPDRLSVTSVLEMCPVLYKFHLQIEESSSEFSGKQATRSLKFHKRLKTVEISGFSGTEGEMDAARYIIQSAVVLEKMIVSYCFSHYLGISEWVKRGKVPLTEERRETIERELGGHAISKNAKVLVRPIYIYRKYR